MLHFKPKISKSNCSYIVCGLVQLTSMCSHTVHCLEEREDGKCIISYRQCTMGTSCLHVYLHSCTNNGIRTGKRNTQGSHIMLKHAYYAIHKHTHTYTHVPTQYTHARMHARPHTRTHTHTLTHFSQVFCHGHIRQYHCSEKN